MKKRILNLLMVVAMGIALTACGADNTNKNNDTGTGTDTSTNENTNTNDGADKGDADKDEPSAEAGTTKEMIEAILAESEQPPQMPIEGDMVKDLYHFDPALLEQYTIMTPLMNVKTNEIAILQVKDAKDIAAVEEGVKQRAADVQKQFETYLQDQYENAKNFKLVTKGNYVLFVIAEDADKIAAKFEALVK